MTNNPVADLLAVRQKIAQIISEDWADFVGVGPSELATADRILAALTPASAEPVTVEAEDHPSISIGNISNYYGGLILKREGGIDYWAIENWNGDDWKECDPRVASALRALSGEKS